MQNDYKTILATCLRLKETAIKNISPLTPNIQAFLFQPVMQEVEALIRALPAEYTTQKRFLDEDCKGLIVGACVNPYTLGLLVRDLENLNVVVKAQSMAAKVKVPKDLGACKKIFISHSSRDGEIVNSFITLLTRGAGLRQDDIFCTSIDGMKITNGEDMRKHIQKNVNGADFAILLISKNYKASEVCLNEMGAVWAINKKVKAYVFPDLQEERVGWLINDKAAEKLNNETALASLYEELQQFYKLPLSLPGWTAQAKVFCEKFQ